MVEMHELAFLFVVGGIAGPFSYWIGATTWRAVDFVAPTSLVLCALAITWAVATPGLVWMAERIKGRGRYAPAEAGGFEVEP